MTDEHDLHSYARTRNPATHVRVSPPIRFVTPSTKRIPRRPLWLRAVDWLLR